MEPHSDTKNNTNRQIYLDHNATTQTDERVLQAMLPYFRESYANPGSQHLFGLAVEEDLNVACEQVSALINARPDEIIFTAGATESINLAIKGLVRFNGRKQIVTVATEHSAVLDTCRYMQNAGYQVSCLPVGADGMVSIEKLREAVTPETLLVSVMHVNNETGVIQPIEQIAKIAHEKGALFLCDTTQSVGKIPVDVKALGIDFMPISAHKFYGPKGIGALYVASETGVKPVPLIHGGRQQRGRRSGTLNVPGIIGLGAACEIASRQMKSDRIGITPLRDRLENALLTIENTRRNGNADNRIYTTTNLCFGGVNAEQLILALQNIAVSNGSACHAITSEPSHVLIAMGLSYTDALSSVRFSLGRSNTLQDIDQAIARVTALVSKARNVVG